MPKIPSLPAISTVADADELPIEDVSASTTKKMTLTKLKEYLQALTSWISASMLNLGALAADVATSQSTTSASVVNLTTTGPVVTVTVGANGMVLLLMSCSYQNSTVGEGGGLYYSVSGATTMTDISMNIASRAQRAATNMQYSAHQLVTGLTPGSNTFTMRYGGNTGGTSTYSNRRMTIVPL